jgi:raffinose/stachyose/melibiose transport system permease protein
MNSTSRVQVVVNYTILILCVIVALYPIVGIFTASLYPSGSEPSGFGLLPSSFNWRNYVTAWTDGHFSTYFRSSAIVAAAVVVGSTFLSILGGFAFGAMRFRGSKTIFYLFILGLIIPTEAVIVSLYYDLQSLHLIDTYWALILVEVSGEVAFGVFWMRASFMSVPRSLLEAARIDGASSWTVLWKILVPYARPSILTLMVLTFADSWNEFFLALVLTTKDKFLTAPAGLQVFSSKYLTDVPLVSAGAAIVAIPVLIVFVIFQRDFIRGVLTGAVKG